MDKRDGVLKLETPAPIVKRLSATNLMSSTRATLLPIASVERESGLSKDTLRIWERRYGFPMPQRDEKGDRLYTLDDLRRLIIIKRLMDRGHRPGKLIPLSESELEALDRVMLGASMAVDTHDVEGWMRLVATHDRIAIARILKRELAKRGMRNFLNEVFAPLVARVGEAWARKEIGVFEERLFIRQLDQFFQNELPPLILEEGTPRVLLTTLSGEEHTLGLRMVEALLAIEDAHPIQLGSLLPVTEIVRATRVKQADIVCLSFSSAYSAIQMFNFLNELRSILPEKNEIWAGGQGVKRLRKPPQGVYLTPELQDVSRALDAWRTKVGGSGDCIR